MRRVGQTRRTRDLLGKTGARAARLPKPNEHDEMDLGYWSVLDLGKCDFDLHHEGAFKGLASARVPQSCNDIVEHRAERDSIHEGPTRVVRFDCLACGACCKDNEVILEKKDFERFEEGGRPELGKPPLTVKRGGKSCCAFSATNGAVISKRPTGAASTTCGRTRVAIFRSRANAVSSRAKKSSARSTATRADRDRDLSSFFGEFFFASVGLESAVAFAEAASAGAESSVARTPSSFGFTIGRVSESFAASLTSMRPSFGSSFTIACATLPTACAMSSVSAPAR